MPVNMRSILWVVFNNGQKMALIVIQNFKNIWCADAVEAIRTAGALEAKKGLI